MLRKIKVYYILNNRYQEKIIALETYAETMFLNKICHKQSNYYIGFSGFNKYNEAIKTVVGYDFYYFYNMVEGIMKITNFIKFEKEMNVEELLTFEINRIKKLQECKMLIATELKILLKEYERYKDEKECWIKEKGSEQLKSMLTNRENFELSYLIERVNFENRKYNLKTI